jgi:GT2 family glycosyltransferase
MRHEPAIAVIVLNWNGFDDTVECLESLRSLLYKNTRTVLVDNASGNDEARKLAELFPEVHLIENSSNRGFAGGNNDGIQWALANGFDFIVNLNNDCMVEPDWLTEITAAVLCSGADFASSRIMCYPQTELINSDADGLLPDGSGFVLHSMQPWNGNREPRKIISACGAASMYSADCIRRVSITPGQFFDELYFAYFEDVDLGFRLHAKNCKGISVPTAVVYHKGQQSSVKYSFFHRFQLEKNRRLNVRLNFPLWMQPISPIYRVAKNIYRGKLINFEKHFGPKPKKSSDAGPIKTTSDHKQAVQEWMKNNKAAIALDRRQRKAAGLISNRAYAAISWIRPFRHIAPLQPAGRQGTTKSLAPRR